MKLSGVFGANPHLDQIARRYYWTGCLVAILALTVTLLEGIGVSLLIPLLGSSTGSQYKIAGRGPLGLLLSIATDRSRNQRMFIIAGVILLAIASKAVLQGIANTFSAWVEGKVGHDIRRELGQQLRTVAYPFFLTESSSRLFNILGTESWKASDAARVLLVRIATGANVFMYGVLLVLISWRLSLIVLVGGFFTRTIQKRLERRLRDLSARTVVFNQKLHNYMLFLVFAARVIRVFHTQAKEEEKFNSSSEAVRRAIFESERVAASQWPLLEAMHGVLLVGVLLISVFSGTSLPVLASFLVLMNRMQPHLRTLEGTAAAFAAASAHFDEVEWLLDLANKPLPRQGEIEFRGLREHITFEQVSYDYGTRTAPALSQLSYTLHRGRFTALLGESGSGKSTFINLLCRMLEPTSGRILVDGKPMHDLRLADWLKRISIAGQDVELFDGTVGENIVYGCDNTDPEQIQEAIQIAGAQFINQLPLGLDTPTGPAGFSLSGGQRQRIGLARALLRKPDLLILDEATNAVDQATEDSILQALQGLRGKVTLLIVSHKPSTLAFCEDALLLQHGHLVSAGSTATVLAGLSRSAQPEEAATTL